MVLFFAVVACIGVVTASFSNTTTQSGHSPVSVQPAILETASSSTAASKIPSCDWCAVNIPRVAVYSWQQRIFPHTVGRVIVTVDEANGVTHTTTSLETIAITDGSNTMLASMWMRNGTFHAPSVPTATKTEVVSDLTIRYPSRAVRILPTSLRWEGELPIARGNATTCLNAETVPPLTLITSPPSLPPQTVDPQDPLGELYELAHVDSFLKSDEIGNYFGPTGAMIYSSCSLSAALPAAYATTAMFLLATSTETINAQSSVPAPETSSSEQPASETATVDAVVPTSIESHQGSEVPTSETTYHTNTRISDSESLAITSVTSALSSTQATAPAESALVQEASSSSEISATGADIAGFIASVLALSKTEASFRPDDTGIPAPNTFDGLSNDHQTEDSIMQTTTATAVGVATHSDNSNVEHADQAHHSFATGYETPAVSGADDTASLPIPQSTNPLAYVSPETQNDVEVTVTISSHIRFTQTVEASRSTISNTPNPGGPQEDGTSEAKTDLPTIITNSDAQVDGVSRTLIANPITTGYLSGSESSSRSWSVTAAASNTGSPSTPGASGTAEASTSIEAYSGSGSRSIYSGTLQSWQLTLLVMYFALIIIQF